MTSSIEETCRCGAKLVYSESVSRSYQFNSAARQADFQEAHSICLELGGRPKEVTSTAALPNKDKKNVPNNNN